MGSPIDEYDLSEYNSFVPSNLTETEQPVTITLKRAGYEGIVTVEVQPTGDTILYTTDFADNFDQEDQQAVDDTTVPAKTWTSTAHGRRSTSTSSVP